MMKALMTFNCSLLFALLLVSGLTIFCPKAHAYKTDGETIGLLIANDKNEIDAAKQAEGKNISSQVLDYAKMLDKDHNEDLTALEELSTKPGLKPPMTAGTVLRAKAAKNLAMRSGLNGHEYEKAYIADMVADHTEDLNLIDTDLMQDVHNSDLKAQLEKTRSHVAMHLDKAKELQAKI